MIIDLTYNLFQDCISQGIIVSFSSGGAYPVLYPRYTFTADSIDRDMASSVAGRSFEAVSRDRSFTS